VPGVPGQFEDNIVRERFNDLIRKTYDGREPVALSGNGRKIHSCECVIMRTK
jgi:hypothetical protein